MAFLNSSAIDTYIRQFNGHTQINASDLRELRYPSALQLEAIGQDLADRPWPSQIELDAVIANHVPGLDVQPLPMPVAA